MTIVEALAFNRGVSSVQEFAIEAADKLDETAATEVERARVKILRDFAGVLPMLRASLEPARQDDDLEDEA